MTVCLAMLITHITRTAFISALVMSLLGLAPIFGLGLAVYSLTLFMYPPLLSWRLLVVICLMISFVFGFNLSRADWINFWYGVPFYLIIIFIVTIIQMLLKKD